MRFRALIHYKNDEEIEGPERETSDEALQDLIRLWQNTEDCSDEDVQFLMVENLDA